MSSSTTTPRAKKSRKAGEAKRARARSRSARRRRARPADDVLATEDVAIDAPGAGSGPRFGYGYPIDTKVEFFRAYDDASGVGCRISWGGFLFSFDVRGVVKHSLIRASLPNPRTQQIALELCTLAFLRLLTSSVDVAWREKNIQLYGVPR